MRSKTFNVYRVDFHDPHLGTMISWFTSESKAKSYLAKMKREQKAEGIEPSGPQEVLAVELPANKGELVEWLNRNFTTDNG